ncbi:uncharacterized protein METZ01_LOCUS182339, partial [marine metagenome]
KCSWCSSLDLIQYSSITTCDVPVFLYAVENVDVVHLAFLSK